MTLDICPDCKLPIKTKPSQEHPDILVKTCGCSISFGGKIIKELLYFWRKKF